MIIEKEFHLYTDGSCWNDKIGSWAYVIINPNNQQILFKESGLVKETTSQTMEIKAAVQGLARAWDELPQGKVILYSDSAYMLTGIGEWVYKWIKDNWRNSKGKSIKQQELWKDLVLLHEKVGTDLKWVKGHSGNRWNDYVDNLATKTIKKQKI